MEVEISIHGAKAETHDALTRIKGSFDKTMQGSRNLKEAGITVQLKCPITRLNQHELYQIRDIADDLGFFMTFDAVITPKDDGSLDPLALRPDEEFLQKYWGEWYLELHHGKKPAAHESLRLRRRRGELRNRAERVHDRSVRQHPPLRRLPADGRQHPGDRLARRSLAEVAGSQRVRDLAVEARRKLDGLEHGQYFQFCLGVAEKAGRGPARDLPAGRYQRESGPAVLPTASNWRLTGKKKLKRVPARRITTVLAARNVNI